MAETASIPKPTRRIGIGNHASSSTPPSRILVRPLASHLPRQQIPPMARNQNRRRAHDVDKETIFEVTVARQDIYGEYVADVAAVRARGSKAT